MRMLEREHDVGHIARASFRGLASGCGVVCARALLTIRANEEPLRESREPDCADFSRFDYMPTSIQTVAMTNAVAMTRMASITAMNGAFFRSDGASCMTSLRSQHGPATDGMRARAEESRGEQRLR